MSLKKRKKKRDKHLPLKTIKSITFKSIIFTSSSTGNARPMHSDRQNLPKNKHEFDLSKTSTSYGQFLISKSETHHFLLCVGKTIFYTGNFRCEEKIKTI